MQVFSPENMNI